MRDLILQLSKSSIYSTKPIKNRMTEWKGSFGVLLSRKGEKMETLTKVIQALKALIVLLELIRWFF
ncbi:hypothetical protein SQ54_23380 [Klebsiella pneumoniae]|nr:hypothetical protein SQ54_23380 [Klebsiella pneumoniae]